MDCFDFCDVFCWPFHGVTFFQFFLLACIISIGLHFFPSHPFWFGSRDRAEFSWPSPFLSFVHNIIDPRLKRDFCFPVLPFALMYDN